MAKKHDTPDAISRAKLLNLPAFKVYEELQEEAAHRNNFYHSDEETEQALR